MTIAVGFGNNLMTLWALMIASMLHDPTHGGLGNWKVAVSGQLDPAQTSNLGTLCQFAPHPVHSLFRHLRFSPPLLRNLGPFRSSCRSSKDVADGCSRYLGDVANLTGAHVGVVGQRLDPSPHGCVPRLVDVSFLIFRRHFGHSGVELSRGWVRVGAKPRRRTSLIPVWGADDDDKGGEIRR